MISSFVITGFLGVGKTTMLTNSVKQHFPDKKIAIIVNEFGDIGVDSTYLKMSTLKCLKSLKVVSVVNWLKSLRVVCKR